MSWAHEATFVNYRGGKVKCLCRCGKQSSKMDDIDTAKVWYRLHTGIREMRRRGR